MCIRVNLNVRRERREEWRSDSVGDSVWAPERRATPFTSAMTAPVRLSAAAEQSSEGHVSRVIRLLHRGREGGREEGSP